VIEKGPRMTLKLYSIIEGLNTGDVLYHCYMNKTPEEANAIREKREKAKLEKEKRKAVQTENVAKKKEQKKMKLDEKKKEVLEKKEKKHLRLLEAVEKQDEFEIEEGEDNIMEDQYVEKNEPDDEEDDDFQYYKDEVGEEPHEDLGIKKVSKKRKLKDLKFSKKGIKKGYKKMKKN
jgi:ribosome biogenesis protein SSF1/2